MEVAALVNDSLHLKIHFANSYLRAILLLCIRFLSLLELSDNQSYDHTCYA